MKTVQFFILLTGLFLLSKPVLADNKTPTNSYAFVIKPVEFHLLDRPETMIAMKNEGYDVEELSNISNSCSPEFGIDEILERFSYLAGAGLINSHGNETGFTGEVYNYTIPGKAARDSAYVYYIGLGYGPYISTDYKEGVYWGIAIRFSTPLTLAGGIFHCQTCYGNNMVASGGGVSYGPSGSCYTSDSKENVKILWETLDGDNGVEFRPSGEAYIECPNLDINGADNITLAPAVNGFSHTSGTQIPSDGLLIEATFDTPVSTASPATACVEASGVLTIESASWSGNEKIAALVKATSPGDGYFTIIGSAIASANCPLLFVNGGNDYSVRLVSGDDPAASVSGFAVVNGAARWKVSSEYHTAEYCIEGSDEPNGPWTHIATEQRGAGCHSLQITGGDFSCYRLVELETSGKKIYHGIAKPGSRVTTPVERHRSVEFLKERLSQLKVERLEQDITGALSSSLGEGETYVVFTVDVLRDAVESYVANYWAGFGYTVRVRTVDNYAGDPDAFRSALKDTITEYAAAGARYFHLIGDANDWQQFSQAWPGDWEQIRQDYLACGYPPGGQPEKDLIPTWAISDTLPRDQGTPWFVPYYLTDRPYADTDDDGVPDVVLTRWPVTEEWEVLELAAKMQRYMNQGVPGGAYSVMTCVGNLDHDGEGDGALASAVADTATAQLPPGQYLSWIYESDVPYDGQRNIETTALWNIEQPNLVLIPSSFSNRSWPGNFFDQTNYSTPFHMDMINNGTPLAVVMALSCDGADFARTEDPEYGLPICHRFLIEPDKGAIAWIGPALGSWQNANEVIARSLVSELYSAPERPAAESYLAAMRNVYEEFSDYGEIVRTADLYVFLGHPLVPFYRIPIITEVDGSAIPKVLTLGQNFPNPFNPETAIYFSTTRKGHVAIIVYDVEGKRIKKLVDSTLPAGRHMALWDGRNHNNSKVASGVYFYRLVTEEGTRTKKMVLLR